LGGDDETILLEPRPRVRQLGALELGVGGVARAQVIVLGVSMFAAVFFAVATARPLVVTLVYSLAIGNFTFWLGFVLHRRRGPRAVSWKPTALAIVAGGFLATGLARTWDVRRHGGPFFEPRVLGTSLAGTVLFGAVVAYYFFAQAKLAEREATLREESLRRLEQQQLRTEAELKLLQAQIEPHFLFNTMTNVLQLVDAEPGAAKRMLLNLTSYLRVSLHRTRAGATTLGEELTLVRAYLAIQAERMGARLSYRIECPEELGGMLLPPLLLQPLVENAVRHGLEAKQGGGDVAVRVTRDADRLLLEVQDTGVGLAQDSRAGVGLTNVRARVRAVSQGRGSMTIEHNEPHGLCVCIALPLPIAAGAGRAGAGAERGPP
jgi:signal transduction histidine kinase